MLIPVIVMSIMGLLFGLGLAFASNIFRVDRDLRIEKILSALPGSNCGACGKAGCQALAESIVKGEADITGCTAGGQDVVDRIAEILGKDSKDVVKKIARVRCGGGINAKDKYIYRGVKSCLAASMLDGGNKLCDYGCLGYADCVSVCPFGAINMGADGIPVVNVERCTGCGKCADECPRGIISIEDARERFYVKCLSRDKAAFVRNACKTGCIGCRVCEKLSKGAFFVQDNLSALDYTKVTGEDVLKLCVEKCPTRCIVEIG